jgi:long-chain acyl-CoA synthetase
MQSTFPALLLEHAAHRSHAPALREKQFGIWQTLDWTNLAALVRAMTCGLTETGFARGQHLVVVGENRSRLYGAMLAAQSLGAVPVPLYQDAVAAEFVFPIGNAEVAFAIVEDQD